MSELTFDAALHAEPIWALMGYKLDKRNRDTARAFTGWPLDRVAATLGLELSAVLRAIEGPGDSPQGARCPEVPTGPAVGSLWRARRMFGIWPLPAGGWTLEPDEAPGERWKLGGSITRADAVAVIGVTGGYVIASAHAPYEFRVRVFRVRARSWDRMFRGVQ